MNDRGAAEVINFSGLAEATMYLGGYYRTKNRLHILWLGTQTHIEFLHDIGYTHQRLKNRAYI